MQKRDFLGTVNFAAQTVDVDLDQVGKGVELFVPYVFCNFRTPDDSIGVADKIFQQRVLLVSERNASPGAA